MRFRVLALDYDGTIAVKGVLDPGVKAAIKEARARRVVVILVTGRILADLKRVAGDVSFFNAIVAENGGVLALPKKPLELLSSAPSATLLEGLRRSGIEFTAGQCIVDTDLDFRPQVLALLRECPLPLSLIPNRDRLMILPHGVNKGTGLRACLEELRQSAESTIGIGDAENDHDLLAACGVGVAVAWGNEALKRQADEVLAGHGPGAVGVYIRRKLKEMPGSVRSRRSTPPGAKQ
jgi:hydroxymethylpyrimidine pyrophosphatase-like HAD family hydrolase